MKNILSLWIIFSVITFAQEKKNLKDDMNAREPVLLLREKNQKEVKDGEMKQYFLVLLKRGHNRTHDSATVVAIQKGHLDNITRLYNEGKIDIAGPMGHDGDLRGIFIFNCSTYEEVLLHCNTDPAIKSGRLAVEIYPWWGGKGSQLR